MKNGPGQRASDEIVHRLETAGFRDSFLPFSSITKIPKRHEVYLVACPGNASVGTGRFSLPFGIAVEPRSLCLVALPDSEGGRYA
jgi:hypothetical protein